MDERELQSQEVAETPREFFEAVSPSSPVVLLALCVGARLELLVAHEFDRRSENLSNSDQIQLFNERDGLDLPGCSRLDFSNLPCFGIFPLIAKKTIDMIKAINRYEGRAKPEKFDQDIAVLRAGSGGQVSTCNGAVV